MTEWTSTDYWPSEKCENPQAVANAIQVLRNRIEQRFPSMNGDKQNCLDGLDLIEFWTTPLQDKGESQGFDDYVSYTVETKFDSDEHKRSWEIGFLKAHALEGKRNTNSKSYREVRGHAEKLISGQSSKVIKD